MLALRGGESGFQRGKTNDLKKEQLKRRKSCNPRNDRLITTLGRSPGEHTQGRVGGILFGYSEV